MTSEVTANKIVKENKRIESFFECIKLFLYRDVVTVSFSVFLGLHCEVGHLDILKC
jgi:hypothetical protein